MESPNTQKYNFRPRSKKHYKDDGASSDNDDGDYDPNVEEEEELFDEATFKKFLYKMFPSRDLKNKIKEMDAITEKMDADEEAKKKKTKAKPTKKKKKKPVVVESESEDDDYETVEESGSSSEDEDDLDDEEGTINIVLTINGVDSEDEDEEENETDSDEEEEEEGEEDNSHKKEKFIKIKDLEKERALLEKIEAAMKALESDQTKDTSTYIELKKFADRQRELIEKYTKKSEKKDKKKNMKEFKSLINTRRENNEAVYFSNLSLKEQMVILEKIKDTNKYTKIDKPYRFKLLEMDIPEPIKSIALRKMSAFQKMEPGGGEYSKLKQWIEGFMRIPFNTFRNFELSLEKNGPEECSQFMKDSTQVLEDAVYGLNDAKMQIMQMIGTWISNPTAIGSAIAIKGPPGTGKTTLVKEGISKVLQRPFSFIALGGSTDSSFLEGHSYTYEGSIWGKIASILMECKCMNPVIYFDELDKVSETPKGEEIIGILTHLIDTSQNTDFRDKYFSEIKLDLSKCLFIFSYNDESKINPILRDRMYKIETKGYDAKEKATIARIHLLPSIRKQIKFTEQELVISDEVIAYIVQNFTGEEKGVRNLKRCLEIIYTKMNLYRFTDTSTEFFKKGMLENVEFPYTLSNRDVDKLVSKKEMNTYLATMYT